MKKTLSLLCCVLLMLQLFSITALADGGESAVEPRLIDDPEGAVHVPTKDGDANVVINGNICTDENGAALVADVDKDGKAAVTVNGDVSAKSNEWVSNIDFNSEEVRSTGVTAWTKGGETSVTVNGDVSANASAGEPLPTTKYHTASAIGVDALAYDNGTASVTINGDVTVNASASDEDIDSGTTGIIVDAGNDGTASVTVNGNVTTGSEGCGVFIETHNGTYRTDFDTINGGTAFVTVNGDVHSEGIGVSVYSSIDSLSYAEINGDIKAKSVGVSVSGCHTTVTVDGDVTSDEVGIATNYVGTVFVSGDVTGGVFTQTVPSDKRDDDIRGLVIVEGTVNPGSQDYALTIGADISSIVENGRVTQYVNTDLIPTIEVGKLEAGKGGDFFGVLKYDETAKEVTEVDPEGNENTFYEFSASYTVADEATEKYLRDNVRYLVREDMLIGEMSVDGTKTSEVSGKDYALEDDVLTVKLLLPAGYQLDGLKAGEYADVNKNADGTYTVTVKRGGDLNLQALLAAAVYKTEYVSNGDYGELAGKSMGEAMRAIADDFKGNKDIRFDTMNSLIVGSELKAFNKLDGEQKLLVMMNLLKLALGHDPDTEGMTKEAAALMQKLTERLSTMDPAARYAKLSRLIQVKDGKAAIEFRIGATHYRFIFNAEDGSFISGEIGTYVLKGYDRLY